MAVTDQQKLDFLLKKIGYTKTKTGSVVGTGAISGTPKQPFAEAIPSPLIIANGALWNEADSIPATPPGADTTQVKVYLAATSGLRMTADATSSGQRAYIAYSTYGNTSSTRLTNWIDTQFGASYIIKVYRGDPNSGGVNLSAAGSGANDGWFFDYSAGVLNFNDTNVPSGVTDTNIYIVGYRYIGQTGAPTSGISTFSFKDLTVERNLDVGIQGGISTFRNNIDVNADLDVDGHTNLDNVNIAGVTTFAGIIEGIAGENKIPSLYANYSDLPNPGTYHGMFAHVHGTQKGYFAHAGGWYELVNKETNGVVGTGTERYNLGALVSTSTTATSLNVTGVTTAVTVDINGDLDVDGHTNLDNVSIAGITTFHSNVHLLDNDKLQFGDSQDFSIYHDGSHTYIEDSGTGGLVAKTSQFVVKDAAGSQNLFVANPSGPVSLFYNNVNRLSTSATGVSITGNNVISGNVSAVDATFTGNVSIGGTLTYEDVQNVDAVGLITARSGIRVTGGVIEAQAGENKIPSLYAAMGNLPSAGSYHGMFAHVHATGRGYFAHAGNWLELVNKEINGVVGTGTERYNIGPVDLTTLDVSGISTFAGNVDINADLDVDGHTNLDNVSIAGVTTTSGHIYINADNKKLIVGQHSDIQIFNDGSNSRIENGSGQLIIKSPILAIQSSGTNQIVSRDLAEVDLYYNGVKKLSTASSGINVVGTTTSTQLAITGVSTFTGAIDANGDLDVDGHTNLDNVSIAGFTTITQDLDVDGHTNLDNVNVSGASTFSNDASFNGGAYAVYIMPGSDIRFANGNWTGEQAGKIQHSSNKLYIQSGSNGTQIRRADGQASWEWQTNGHFIPGLNSNVNIGESAKRVLNIYTDNLDVDSHTNLDNVSIVGVTTHQGHVLPSADATYDLGSSSKQWRNFYVSNIVSAPGFGIIGPDLTVRNFTATGISTHVGIATFNNATFHDDVTFDTANGNDIRFDKSDNSFRFGDECAVRFGGGNDLKIQHYQNNSYIDENGAGALYIRSSELILGKTGTFNKFIRGVQDAQVELYYNNNKKLETKNNGIEVTGLTDTDTLLSSGNATFSGTITAGGATGNNGQYLKSTGSGVAWESFPTLRTRNTFTASAGQTTFSFSYTVNFLDVFVNGIKLTDAEFTATNGSSVVLAVGCFVGDIVELVSYNTVSGGGGGGGSLNNIVEDTTPQLGGNLDLFNKSITGTGNVNITGIITATNFVGDGSGLTGITASGSGVVVKNSGSTVGTAGTINFGDNLSVSPASAGIVTITGAIGITTNSGVVSIANDLDVDGHTNLDNVSVAGVTTFSDRVRVLDSNEFQLGNAADLRIKHSAMSEIASQVNSSIINYRGFLRIANFANSTNTGHPNADSMFIDAHTHQFRDQQSHLKAKFIENSAVELYHDGNLKFSTASSGINIVGTTTSTQLAITGVSTFTGAIDANGDLDVDGHTELDNVNIAGVVTATTFKGALQGTSGTFSSGVDITGDLDVDGHTDLDNVSIAGVVTATTFVGNGDFVELDVDGHTNLDNVNVAGVSTFSGVVSGVQVNLQSAGGELINVTSTNAASRSTIKFNTNGNDYEIGARGSSADNPNNFYIYDNNANSYRMLINSNGAVSILGDLDVDGHTNLDNVSIAGVVTATSFVGDGSGLTGITASGSGIVIKHDGSTVGTAGTINFGTNLDVSAISGGAVTITATGSGSTAEVRTNTLEVVGVTTFSNDVDFKGSGGSTKILFDSSQDQLEFADSATLTFGNHTGTGDYNISYVNGADFTILGMNGGSGDLVLGTFASGTTTKTLVSKRSNNALELYFANNKKLETTNTGVTVTGTVAATSFSGDGSNLTGISANVGITTNLSGTFTASAGSPTTLNSFGYGSGDTVFEYTIYIKNGSDFQTQKLLAMRDGTTVHSTQFAVMFSSSLLVQCDATISSGNILLRATPETGVSGSTTFKVKREVM